MEINFSKLFAFDLRAIKMHYITSVGAVQFAEIIETQTDK